MKKKQLGQFKALSTDRKEWVYGDLVHFTDGDVSIMTDMKMIAVEPATVCRIIGKTDKHGKAIYSHDILRYICEGSLYYEDFEVFYDTDSAAFRLRNKDGVETSCCKTYKFEIMGNVFDN